MDNPSLTSDNQESFIDIYLNVSAILTNGITKNTIDEIYILCKKLIDIPYEPLSMIGFNGKEIKSPYSKDKCIKEICELIVGSICFLPPDKMVVILMECYNVPIKKEIKEEFNLWINSDYINLDEQLQKNDNEKYNEYVALINCLSMLNKTDKEFESYLPRYKKEIEQIKNYIKFLDGK